MKQMIYRSLGLALLSGMLLTSHTFAQTVEVTKTTTTSDGTVSEFGPQGIVIKTETGVQPVRYMSNETTNYVDQDGNPVTLATVTSGLPVTVYYTKVGDTLIASKIMVKKGGGVPVQAVADSATVTSGVVSEFGPERIILKTATSADPLHYTFSKKTTYVDENGLPVAVELVKNGSPVTVHYTKVGSMLMADKVIVRKTVAAPTAVIEEKKTVITTTTTNK
jgi:hypothetical protein